MFGLGALFGPFAGTDLGARLEWGAFLPHLLGKLVLSMNTVTIGFGFDLISPKLHFVLCNFCRNFLKDRKHHGLNSLFKDPIMQFY